jgi:hypothetical protein
MQTFLPYPDFAQSAQCLDYRRLGKQRVEVLQLLNALLTGGGWRNHPAAKMWRGYEPSLAIYGIEMCHEWVRRGYRDTCLKKLRDTYFSFPFGYSPSAPPWLGRDDFHSSHRSNLLRKDPAWYGQWGWTDPDNLSYVWPV